MKKNTYLLVFYLTTSFLFFTTIASFGQSLLITPEQTVSENTYGDNIILRSNNAFIGIQGIRYNGTKASKTPVLNGDHLLRLSAGGSFDPPYEGIERASIFFKASQNWSDTANGTRILFMTTNNNTVKGIINTAERMVIDQNGRIGIGTSTPISKLDINHSSVGPADGTHIHLRNTGEITSTIKTSSALASGIWLNGFTSGDYPETNIVSWHNVTYATTPLVLDGAGDISVGRNATIIAYTALGSDAPKVKMKKLTITTNGSAGGVASIPHGLTQAKIVSVSVLVNAVTGNDIPPSFTASDIPGFEYFYWVSSTEIIIKNSNGNHTAIANRSARILITYEE